MSFRPGPSTGLQHLCAPVHDLKEAVGPVIASVWSQQHFCQLYWVLTHCSEKSDILLNMQYAWYYSIQHREAALCKIQTKTHLDSQLVPTCKAAILDTRCWFMLGIYYWCSNSGRLLDVRKFALKFFCDHHNPQIYTFYSKVWLATSVCFLIASVLIWAD